MLEHNSFTHLWKIWLYLQYHTIFCSFCKVNIILFSDSLCFTFHFTILIQFVYIHWLFVDLSIPNIYIAACLFDFSTQLIYDKVLINKFGLGISCAKTKTTLFFCFFCKLSIFWYTCLWKQWTYNKIYIFDLEAILWYFQCVFWGLY